MFPGKKFPRIPERFVGVSGPTERAPRDFHRTGKLKLIARPVLRRSTRISEIARLPRRQPSVGNQECGGGFRQAFARLLWFGRSKKKLSPCKIRRKHGVMDMTSDVFGSGMLEHQPPPLSEKKNGKSFFSGLSDLIRRKSLSKPQTM